MSLSLVLFSLVSDQAKLLVIKECGLATRLALSPQLAAPHQSFNAHFRRSTVLMHKVIDLAMLLVELINYVPLDHVFEKLDLENVLGVLQYGCGRVTTPPQPNSPANHPNEQLTGAHLEYDHLWHNLKASCGYDKDDARVLGRLFHFYL
jgi:hypothetical protein